MDEVQKRRVTLLDIAADAGVSRATASLVIRKLCSVIETLKARTGLGLTMFQPRLNRPLTTIDTGPHQLGATAAESLLRRIKRHDSLIQTTVLHPRCLPSSLVERYPKS